MLFEIVQKLRAFWRYKKGYKMLKSLWSGVSGLQAHQIAMDVEGHNIANVNTVGFKYSRANFADMLSQTKRIATAPQSGLGGQNDLSIGLGVGISSTTKIFLQGSMQNTDKTTDLAIRGDGFFIVSADRGVTQKYTRAGDFLFDANGSMVDNNGYVVQGWTREIKSHDEDCPGDDLAIKVDSSGPIGNIRIKPGLTLPARKSDELTLKANLNTGSTIEQMDCVRQLDSTSVSAADGIEMKYDSAGKPVQIAEDFGVIFDENGHAMNLSAGQGVWVSYKNSEISADVPITVGTSTITINGQDITFSNDSSTSGQSTLVAAQSAIDQYKDITGIRAYVVGTELKLENENKLEGGANKKNIVVNTAGTGAFANFTDTMADVSAFRYKYSVASDADSTSGDFRTTEDLRALMQQDANYIKDPTTPYVDSAGTNASVKVVLNSSGQYEILNRDNGNNDTENLTINVTAYFDETISKNEIFSSTMQSLNTGLLTEGGASTYSGVLNAAKHSTSINIYDSLGSQHTLQVEFRKLSTKEWGFRVMVPEPGEITGHPVGKNNVFENGKVTFNDDGSLSGMNPPTIIFDPKNGAKAPQRIKLDFGTAGTFDGLTSVDALSTTSNIAQNGYAAGDLVGLRVDASGTVIGSFSNGKAVGLAQVSMAKFANNAGLMAEGDNLFTVSANSGDPVVGTPGSGGRGDISASMLEMSNVDLSRSLTQLIVVQRGFQANSKTVTTSDQLLNTLLQLKQ